MEYQPEFFDDVKRMFAETDRRMKETDLRMKETDLRMKETDLRMKETDRQMKETDRKLKEVSRQLGRFGNEIGFFIQELIRPGLVRLLRGRGIDVHRVFANVEGARDGLAAEYDLIAVNGGEVVVVEVKKKLRTEDVKDHIQRISKFRVLFPEYENYEIMGAMAGMSVPPNTAFYAERSGFFVIAPSGEDVQLLNSDVFRPTVW